MRRARDDIAALRRALDDAAASREEAAAMAALLRDVIDALPVGVVVRSSAGVTVRNRWLGDGGGDRQVEALIARAVDDAFAASSVASHNQQTLELHHPVRRSLAISARPLAGGTVAIVEDVSEQRQTDAVRRDFVANVSHELRTPIGALAVLAEALADEREPAVVARLSERIAAEAARAVRLIEDLLDLSRVEVAATTARTAVDVASVVAAAYELVAGTAGARNVIVDVSAVEAGVTILVDERQLVSAVRNLIDNAVHYSEPGGTVTVAARRAGDNVAISVADRGVGIPARDLDRIFERFYRVDRARSRETGGSGLGLAIVRHVAQNHGGDVTVESVEGAGSTFMLRLPAG